MAAGMASGSLLASTIPLKVLLAIGLLLGLGGLLSFLHLGRKRNAWRAVLHLKKSWLSREILLAGLFGVSWAITAGWIWLGNASVALWPMALLGLATVYSMGRVYLLRSVPGWNNWRTPLSFFLSAIVLGTLGMNLFLPGSAWVIVAGIAMLAELGLSLSTRDAARDTASRGRIILLLLTVLGCLLIIFTRSSSGIWQASLLFGMALAAEVIGRCQFYNRRRPFPMQTS
jgi:DMSO reductase anchor subunit